MIHPDIIRLFGRNQKLPKSSVCHIRDFQTIVLMLCYKIKYPNNFFLLRGNHEVANLNRIYGFYDECELSI